MIKDREALSRGVLPKLSRLNCREVWNAGMVHGASFSAHDIPHCPTYLPGGLPQRLISFPKAKVLYNKELKSGNPDYHCNAFVHFYCDDFYFDGPKNSIWTFPNQALKILRHYDGVISPDFSTYADFPDPLKRYNTYRMRAFGYACFSSGIPIINNVRWGTDETWEYCFDGIDQNSVVSIGTVASDLRDERWRLLFNQGFRKMQCVLSPKTVILYGSVNRDILRWSEYAGLQLLLFPSETNIAHQKGGPL